MMKKIFCSCVAIVLMALTACTSNNPVSVAEKAMANLQKGNYEAYAEQLYVAPDVSPEEAQEQRDMIVSLLNDKYAKMIEERGGLKSYSVVSEDVADEAGTARVEFNVVYGNGSEEKMNVDLKKDESGDWKVHQKK